IPFSPPPSLILFSVLMIPPPPRSTLFPYTTLFRSLHPERYAVITLIVLVLCGLVVLNLRRSRVGRRLIAVRTNERAAAALGVNRSEEHTSELQSLTNLVCRLLLEKTKTI